MSKEGKRISKTMQRMKGDFELVDGNKYGTYKLPTQVDTRPENPETRKRNNITIKISVVVVVLYLKYSWTLRQLSLGIRKNLRPFNA